MTAVRPEGSWKAQALRALGSPGALRVFDTPELVQWLATFGLKVPERTLRRALAEWESSGLVGRAARGLYLNGLASPLTLLEEAAPRLRQGAVVSLATVLGRAGALNNPTHWVTAVVPSDNSSRPVNELESESGSVFRFASLRHDLFLAPTDPLARDAFQPYAAVPTATPEKALLDWLYLSSRGRGAERWPLPPSHDWDMSLLDGPRLDRLATRLGLENELQQFRQGLEAGPRIRIRRKMG